MRLSLCVRSFSPIGKYTNQIIPLWRAESAAAGSHNLIRLASRSTFPMGDNLIHRKRSPFPIGEGCVEASAQLYTS